jgi:DNA-directed RNA polymerase specialized sigma24 family protein
MSEHATLPDAELVQRCKAGDPEAWNELVARFSRYVYAICTRGFRLSDADAEDVFQEVFARVYSNLQTLRDDAAVRPWIAQLTRRRPDAEPVREGSHDALAEIDEAFTVREAMSTLSGPCQEMLDRFFTRDQSYRTISEELELPAGTIASRIARCLGKLRSELEGRNQLRGGSRE